MLLPYSNLQVKHQNPGASQPLVLPIHVVCNTSDDQIHDNIRANSRRSNRVMQARPAHDGVAVLCGSGPSLSEHLDDIRKWKRRTGADVFAMNGAASYLAANGITPDYQVIIDAREETAQLVGPAHEHLFASQVHPACFEKEPHAIVWHLQITGIDDLFPDGYPAHTQIGGAASVGNTATCLAYAMGYRNLQIYGYDSSHRDGHGHAFSQPMNEGDPCARVVFDGKEYLCSLTMKLQAEKFQDTARDLRQLGCQLTVHGDGLLPAMFNTPKEALTERQKYERMWAYPGYRTVSPGEEAVETFLTAWGDRPRGTLLDIGCGTGRAGLKLKQAGFAVTLMDFAENSRDWQTLGMAFVQHDITQPFPIAAWTGYCTDVMEHIPTADVRTVMKNILAATQYCFLQISTQPDMLGAVINQDLHLTVKPWHWWVSVVEACGGRVLWSNQTETDVQMIVS